MMFIWGHVLYSISMNRAKYNSHDYTVSFSSKAIRFIYCPVFTFYKGVKLWLNPQEIEFKSAILLCVFTPWMHPLSVSSITCDYRGIFVIKCSSNVPVHINDFRGVRTKYVKLTGWMSSDRNAQVKGPRPLWQSFVYLSVWHHNVATIATTCCNNSDNYITIGHQH